MAMNGGNGEPACDTVRPLLQPLLAANPGGGDGIQHDEYSTRKSYSQGALIIAHLTANAGLLRKALIDPEPPYSYVVIALLCLAILLQLVCGVILFRLGRTDVTGDEELEGINNQNSVVSVLSFLIMGLIVLANAFTFNADEPS